MPLRNRLCLAAIVNLALHDEGNIVVSAGLAEDREVGVVLMPPHVVPKIRRAGRAGVAEWRSSAAHAWDENCGGLRTSCWGATYRYGVSCLSGAADVSADKMFFERNT